MTGKSHQMTHSIPAQESDRPAIRDSGDSAWLTGLVVTCFLMMTLALTTAPGTLPEDESATPPASAPTAADSLPYFPSQYTLNAPDAVPGTFATF